MKNSNRRQFFKTTTAAGLVSLIAPSFALASTINEIGDVLLTIGRVKVALRLVYWDKSKTWHPLELVQKGNIVETKGPVKVTLTFIDEGEHLTYDMDVKSPEPTRVGILLSLPGTTTETPVFHVLPGLLFGDNNLANVRAKSAFPHLTHNPLRGRAFSPVWEFRADRCAMPLSAMCSEKAVIAISIDPYTQSISKSGKAESVVCGVMSMLADDHSPASCGVTLGYANLPYTFSYQNSFPASKEDSLSSGKISGRIYAKATRDRRSVNGFVREEYEHRRSLPKVNKTLDEALVATAAAMKGPLWSKEHKAFCNLYFEKGATDAKDARKRILAEIGWCGGPSIALPVV